MKPTLNTYISDMLGLENEMLQPIKAQSENANVAKFPAVQSLLTSLRSNTETHIRELEQQLDRLGGHAATGIKAGLSSALGAVANVIDAVRKTEVSKDLRDDYTALSLACVSYGMLHTTALAQGDREVADLAKRNLTDYATFVMRINDAMPEVVIAELQEEGVAIDASMAGTIKESLDDAWNQSVTRVGKGR